MPGGGLLSLVAYGSQNVILSGNPDMTYFYKTFKKYTHFALETTTKGMDGPSYYPYDTSTQVRARVDRVGDLLSDMYFSFEIPAIYSKYRKTNQTQGPVGQLEFEWVRYLGAAAIQSVSISIGPNKVQEFTGEYIMARAMIDYNADKFQKWRKLVGDTPEITSPANGLYGSATVTGGGYPTVYEDTTNSTQTNAPSIPSYTIYVPLPFWFTEEGQALPLVGLQYYTVDVTINLRPSQTLYTTLDISGFRMAPGFGIVSPQANIQGNIPDVINVDSSKTQLLNFMTDINKTLPALNTWLFKPTLHTTYVFLPETERTLFATTPLSYLNRQVTHISFPEIVNNQALDLDIHNPITRIIILPRRSDVLQYKNSMDNITNWWDWPNRPKILTKPIPEFAGSSYIIQTIASGRQVTNGQLDIINNLRVLSDGNQLQELKPNSFYTDLTHFKYLDGGVNNIPVYSFELYSPSSQPSGSVNSSRIRNFQIDLQINPLPPKTTYMYTLDIYVENINFFIVSSGMGDNKYAL